MGAHQEDRPVLVERHGAICVVRLNRPNDGNSINAELYAQVGEALIEVEHDDAVRAVIITAVGERVFCAGMDLKAFADGKGMDPTRPGFDVFTRRIYPKPIIAAVNGAAVAGGMELVMGCDLVVSAPHARFGIPEVKRGLVAVIGTSLLPRRLPIGLALELGLTGDLIDAQRAYDLGLINLIAPADQLMAEAIKLAERVAANGPLALKLTKQLMYEAQGALNWEHVREVAAPAFASEDAREGALAFAEKRAPVWKGR
ncbi:MAG: enoyl-CoA hydratase-related protein [Caulobacterales bacterium]